MLMHYVKFDDIHSFDTLNLLLSDYNIPPATPKVKLIEIEGRDSPIDATEATGRVNYNKRACSWEFTMLDTDYVSKRKQVSNLLNGKFCKITMYDDPEYYYLGRLVVNDYDRSKTVNKIIITSDVQPYKLRQSESSVSWDFSITRNLIEVLNTDSADVTKRWSIYSYATINNGVLLLSKAGANSTSPFFSVEGLSALSFSCKTSAETLRIYIHKTDASGNTTRENTMLTNGKLENWIIPTGTVKVAVSINPTSIASFPITVSSFQVEAGAICTEYVPKDGFIVTNDRKFAVPAVIVTDDNTSVTMNGITANLSAGEHKILDFELKEGENVVLASGSGTITFNYQEGSL